jgi:hypothetical protein
VSVDRITLFGEGLTLAEFAYLAGQPESVMLERLTAGLAPEQALKGSKLGPGRAPAKLAGVRFGRLVALHVVERGVVGNIWLCRCDCGTLSRVQRSNLNSGATQSCGCLNREVMAERDLIVLTGQRFGRLEVLERSPNKPGSRDTRWLCRCDCGKELSVLANSLSRGVSRSCGCLNLEVAGKAQIIDLTGQRFGRLVALRAKGRQGSARPRSWVCRCDCGNETVVPTGTLRSGSTRSCGCLNKERIGALQRTRARRFDLFGVQLSVLELAEMCGLEKSTVNKALERGMTPEEILTIRPNHRRRRPHG